MNEYIISCIKRFVLSVFRESSFNSVIVLSFSNPASMAERSKALSCPLAVIARRSLCPEKLGSNPGQGCKGINFSGWHGLDMSVTVTKRR